MGAQIQHKVRGRLGKETTYTLTDQALTWEADGDEGSIPFAEIKQINLKISPVDIVDPEKIHGQMTIKTKSGQRLEVYSHHYEHLVYTSRVETYGLLARALCQRVAAESPSARFTNGAPVLRILYLILVAVCGALSVLLALVIVFGEANRELLVACGISITVTAASWSLSKNSKTHEFDGTNPPAGLLTF